MALSRTWYNALVDDDGTNTTGTRWDKAAVNSLMNDIDAALIQTRLADLLFTDATYDIGKSGATRPRDGFFSRNVSIGGTLAVTGALTSAALTTTGNIINNTASAQIKANPQANTNLASLVLGDGSVYGWTLYRDTNAGGLSGTSDAFVIYSNKATAGNRLVLSPAGELRLPAYTAATFVAGDKYLVVDANGVMHRSALGPAS